MRLLALPVLVAGVVLCPALGGAQVRPMPGVAPAAAGSDAAAPAVAPLVYVVRHAEKAPEPGDDPGLSATGRTRAADLAAALADAGVGAVIVTPRRRTGETAAVLAARRGLAPEVVPFGAGTAEHAALVAAAVRRHAAARPGQAVLVVGHSNTVPAVVAALGGPRLPDLCDATYATLFVVRPAARAVPAAVVRAQYGRPDAPEADACPAAASTPMR